VRALESPNGLTREAATYFDFSQLRLALKFNTAYTGNLRLYAIDWDSTARRELISVNGQTAALSGNFSQGAWVTFPISAAAGETVRSSSTTRRLQRRAVRHLPGLSR